MRIAVDFDNVIYDYDGRWRGGVIDGTPVAGAVEAMQWLAKNDCVLLIFSTRNWLKAHRDRIAAWLIHHDIPFHEVAKNKPNADIYLDDKALHFTDWDTAIKALSAWRTGEK